MSVLIDMLRDLDRRGKAPLMQSDLVAAIETVPEQTVGSAKRSGAMRLLIVLGAAAVLGAIAWWLLWRGAPGNSHLVAPPLLTRVEPAPPPAAPLPAPAPAPNYAAAATNAPAPAPAKAATAAAKSVADVAPVAGSSNDKAPTKAKPAPRSASAMQPAQPASNRPNIERAAASGKAAARPIDQGASVPVAANESIVRFSGNSGNAPADLARAYDLAQRGRDVEAIDLLQRTVHDWPQHAESRSALATLLDERGQRKEALAVLLDGAAGDPAHFAITAARLQIELGDPSGALNTLALVPQPQRNAEYHATAAAIAQRAGRHDMAIEEFRIALASGKPRAIWWVGLGSSLEQVGQKLEALKAYRQAQAQGDISSATSDFLRERIATLAEASSASLAPSQGPPAIATRP